MRDRAEFRARGTFDNYVLALLAVAAEGYFALLGTAALDDAGDP